MPSVVFFNVRFTPPLWACLIALLGSVCFLSLGYWQLHRAEEKRALLMRHAHFAQQKPKPWQAKTRLPEPDQRISLTGQFQQPLFLLDNQHDQHQIGYHVLSPFLISPCAKSSSNCVVIIDRGWIAANPNRQKLPDIHTPYHTLQLSGTAYYPSKKHWTLGALYEIRTSEPIVLETLDTQLISTFLHKSLNPFIIRLNQNAPYGYQRHWTVVNMPPERHLGYALQWFSLAFMNLILLIALNTKIT